MPTNHYFNFYGNRTEQRLVEDLMVEAIKQFGFDGYYIANENDEARDLLFGEDPLKTFRAAYPVEIYMSNAEGYVGEQEFFSKFGLEIRNSMNVMLSKRTFQQRVPQNVLDRPREGDLIYVPFSGASGQGELFEIKFVQANKDFFMLGRKSPYFYELQLEKFKYSQEFVDTGVPEIDIISEDAYTIVLDLNTITGQGDYVYKELVYQGSDAANAATKAYVSNWNAPTGELSIINIVGEFQANTIIIGENSNARWQLVAFDPIEDSHLRDVYDNKVIQREANNVVITTDNNPFGSIGNL